MSDGRPRVLFLTPRPPFPPRQGTTLRTWGLLSRLADRFHVTVMTFAVPPLDLEGLRRVCDPVLPAPMPRHTPTRRLRALAAGQADLARRCWSARLARALRERLRAEPFDVVHLDSLEMTVYLDDVRAGRGRGGVVYGAHNVEHVLQARAAAAAECGRWPALRRWYARIQTVRLRRLEALVCQRVDRVVCVSEFDAACLTTLVPSLAPIVVPNGVSVSDYDAVNGAPGPEASPRIVFTGTMDYRPNVDAVLWFAEEILPRIRAERPDAEFLAVGQRPGPRIRRLHGRDGITVTGAVDDVRPFLAAASVVVAPIRIASGTRVKLLEAMAAARPTVATPLAAEGLAVQAGRDLVLADSAADFAAAVVGVLGDPGRASGLGAAGRALVDAHYDWSRIAPALAAVYDAVRTTGP